MMRVSIILFAAVVNCSALFSQGIAGKRTTLEANFNYFLSLAPTEHAFTFGTNIRAGYVLTPRWQLCAGINYFQLNLKMEVIDPSSNNTGYGYSYLGEATDRTNNFEFDITGRYFLQGLSNRKYSCIAPDGKYIELGTILTQTKYSPGEIPGLNNFETLLSEVNTVRLSFGFGNQQVWWDRLIVNTGILFSVPVVKITDYNEYTAPYMAWTKRHNSVRAYFGIGVLI